MRQKGLVPTGLRRELVVIIIIRSAHSVVNRVRQIYVFCTQLADYSGFPISDQEKIFVVIDRSILICCDNSISQINLPWRMSNTLFQSLVYL